MGSKHIRFEELYEAYAPEIKRFIFASARKDPDLTEDLFQNTWENALKYLHTLEDGEKARAWLYSIARNEAKRHFANRKTKLFDESMMEDGEDILDIADGEEGFPEAMANSDMLAGLVNRLSAPEQQLILLHYYYDMSMKDIADMGRANYNTVKSLMRRAVGKMKKMAEE